MDRMRGVTSLLLLVVACALGAVGGYLVRGLGAAVLQRPGFDNRTGSERDAVMRIELARLHAENEALAAHLADIARREEERAAVEAVPVVAKAGKRTVVTPLKLKSVDEADALCADALARADLDAVLQLGAALLSMGEDGYEKFLALVTEFGKAMQEDGIVRDLFGDERNAGLALRYCAENVESLLKFGLYLHAREGDDVPQEAQFLRREFDAELGHVLLGFYGGGDTEIDDGLMQMYTRKIAAALEEGGSLESRDVEKSIDGLSMLKSEQATQTLVELAENAPAGILPHIARALVFQGTPRALAAFEKLAAGVQDAKQLEAIEQLRKRRQERTEE
jgi:hypothetical protein